MHIANDADLVAALKAAAARTGCSPAALIEMVVASAAWSQSAVVPNFGPRPHTIDEAVITPELADSWPEWVAHLAPAGSKWERLHWPNGSYTVRLINPTSLVLAAVLVPPDAKE